jgi:hypothetical protein
MWLKGIVLKSLDLEQHQGYSLIDALREDEEELGFDHDDPPIVVQKLTTHEQVSAREPSPPPLSPASSWTSGLPSDPPTPPPPRGSGAFGRSLVRRNAWPIRPRRVANTLENTAERIYSTPWLRFITQLSRDTAANVVAILTMIPFALWKLISWCVWLCSKIISWCVWFYSKISGWIPPVGIIIALADLMIRA